MAWTHKPLKTLQDELLICGPIVRDVQNYDGNKPSVSVWFVLTVQKTCMLTIGQSPDKNTFNNLLQSETDTGIKIGEHLFVYLLTADVDIRKGKDDTTSPKFKLSNEIYEYKIGYTDISTSRESWDPRSEELKLSKFGLGGRNRPSFTFAGGGIEDVNIFHGSCRKPHGGYEQADALALLHDPITKNIDDAVKRPQLLVLTGDQIYADDVADVLLYMIRAYIPVLFEKSLGIHDEEIAGKNVNINPGNRTYFLENRVGFTAMIGYDLAKNKKEPKTEYSKSHLISFEEYFLMYMFVWSDVLWNIESDFRLYEWSSAMHSDLYPQYPRDWLVPEKVSDEYDDVKIFASTLPFIRNIFANIPVYMMFDDHDVTDDWNLNENWTSRVKKPKLGHSVIENALRAYKFCQHWGNEPSYISSFNETPSLEKYYYRKYFPSFELLALDLRTQRGLGPEKYDYAALISEGNMNIQIPSSFSKDFVFVLSGTPVIGVPKVEILQKAVGDRNKEYGRYDKDAEAWGLNRKAYHLLFLKLAIAGRVGSKKIIFLSGDVHYAFAAKCEFTSNTPLYNEPSDISIETKVLFLQLCSSSLKNHEEGMTSSGGMHTAGYHLLPDTLPMKLLKWGIDQVGGATFVSGSGLLLTLVGGAVLAASSAEEAFEKILEKKLDQRNRFAYFSSKTTIERASKSIRQNIRTGGVEIVEKIHQKVIKEGDIVEIGLSGSAIEDKAASLWSTHTEYFVEKLKAPGKEIIGYNNISQIKITSESGVQKIEQITYWVTGGMEIADDGTLTIPKEETKFSIPLTTETP